VPETNGAAFSYGHGISETRLAGRYQGVQSDELTGVPGNAHAQTSFDANTRMDVAGALQGANFMAPAVMQSNFHRWTEGATEDSTFSPGLFGLAEWEGLDSFAVGGMGELDNLFSYSEE
jgi:galactonate dehydratase